MQTFRGHGVAMRRPVATVGALLLLVGCAAAAPPPTPTVAPAPTATEAPLPAPVATNAVTIANFAFGPAAITVPAGSVVTWTNSDIEQHTATARDRTFNSDIIANAKTFSFTFATPGTYRYACLIHPTMVGEVVVTPK
jgi:plastocyanin